MAFRAQLSATSDNLSINKPLDEEFSACISIAKTRDLTPEATELDSKGCCSQDQLTSGGRLTEVSTDCAVVGDGPNSATAEDNEDACEPRSTPEEREHQIQV